MTKLVYGVGFNDRKYPANSHGKPLKEYIVWLQMIMRCYSENYQNKRPTYIGCTVSENFKSYSYFYEWCQKQVGFGEDGFQLDKDILLKGNKIYSEDTCVFVPVEINSLVISCNSRRGDHPIGVYFDKQNNKYLARCSVDGKQLAIGYFNDPISAFEAYKYEKEQRFKIISRRWRGRVDERVYLSLLERTVDIDD